jgi:hypothetical protein
VYLSYDRATNALRLALNDTPAAAYARTIELHGVIDIAANGRLAGIELRDHAAGLLARSLRDWLADPIAGRHAHVADDGSVYIELSVGADDDIRSADALLLAEFDSGDSLQAVTIPRRGAGYEISYPSGNR